MKDSVMCVFRVSTKCISMVMTIALLVSPTLIDVAWAQESKEIVARMTISQMTQVSSGRATGQSALSADVDFLDNGSNGRAVHAKVHDGNNTAEFRYENNRLTLSDGYTLTVE